MMTIALPDKIMILWILFQLNEELVELRVCLTSLFALIIEPMQEFPEFWQIFPFFLGGKVLPVVESFSIMWFWALWQRCFFFYQECFLHNNALHRNISILCMISYHTHRAYMVRRYWAFHKAEMAHKRLWSAKFQYLRFFNTL